MYTLYFHPHSQHSRRVVALLDACRLPYEPRLVSLESGEHMSDAYLAINPNHQVPTLVDGDLVLHESTAILRYLCNRHRLDDWYPTELARRAIVDQWTDWGQSRMAPAVKDIVYNSVFATEAERSLTAIAHGKTVLGELVPLMEAALGETNWIAGTREPTIADLVLGSNITQLGLAGWRPSGGRIKAWYGRLCEIKAFADTLPVEHEAV
ncbi:glutathione S-transferase family protein [Maricaulis sp.]|uniref:glutathione S-transferase family protein n=1 Tax=Maricaulis sp. TaxID=1486257 RepID=UPI0025C5AB54|nr:glutathione S-transferase family protein [Maricaulis sp.]